MAALCREVLASGKPLYTFAHPANTALLKAGARAVTPDTDWKEVLTCKLKNRRLEGEGFLSSPQQNS